MSDLSSVSNIYPNQSYYLNNPNNRYINVSTQPPQDNTVKTVATVGLLQAIALGLPKVSKWFGQKLMMGKEFTTPENIYKTANHMVNSNKLDVTVDFLDNNRIKNYPKEMRQMLEPVARGENAFFADKLKLAVAPKSKPSLILHELGHAINAKKGGILKLFQKSRMHTASIPTALFMLNGLFKDRSNPYDNQKNFIERNAGKIGFLAFLPTIIEEGLASLRGVKAAKKILPKVNLSALKRNYFFAWMTYIIAGLGLGVASKLAVTEIQTK